MAIRANHNLYPGINPHLNSALQQPGGGWQSFHADFITYLREYLDTVLPENYYASSETSLQIGRFDAETGGQIGKQETMRPDVTLFSERRSSARIQEQAPTKTATLTIPIAETVDDEEVLNSIVIYKLLGNLEAEKPIVRVEVFSPNNKTPISVVKAYRQRRITTLRSGLRLVEIDLLHETPPILRQIASYPEQNPDAFPYMLLMSDPGIEWTRGSTSVFGFGILDSIPVLEVPLDGTDRVTVDITTAYNDTIQRSRRWRKLIDYAQTPANFAAYTSADQQRIAALMSTIASEQVSNE